MEITRMNIIDTWDKEGGLITINLAADIIGIKQPSVSYLADKGILKSFYHKKKRYLSYNDVIKHAAKKNLRSS